MAWLTKQEATNSISHMLLTYFCTTAILSELLAFFLIRPVTFGHPILTKAVVPTNQQPSYTLAVNSKFRLLLLCCQATATPAKSLQHLAERAMALQLIK